MSDDDEPMSFGSISSHGHADDDGEGEGDGEGEKESEVLSQDALYEDVTEKNKVPDNERTTPKYLISFSFEMKLIIICLNITMLF